MKDSRPGDGTIWRRRLCVSCGTKFSTVECVDSVYHGIKKIDIGQMEEIRDCMVALINAVKAVRERDG